MTSKHKPPIAAKKRPAADQRKPVKAAAAEKSVAHTATVREKDHRPKTAAAPRKAAGEAVVTAPAPPPAPVAVEPARVAERPVDGKSESPGAIHNDTRKARVAPRAGEGHDAPSNGGAKPPVEKKPALGIERRAPVVGEDRQSQLKLLIARGKEQGYLTYAQVNDHLPSEIVDPEQIEDIVNTINDMGIPVYEKAPDTESLLQTEPS